MSVVIPVTLTDEQAELLRRFTALTNTMRLRDGEAEEWVELRDALAYRVLIAAECAMHKLQSQEAHS